MAGVQCVCGGQFNLLGDLLQVLGLLCEVFLDVSNRLCPFSFDAHDPGDLAEIFVRLRSGLQLHLDSLVAVFLGVGIDEFGKAFLRQRLVNLREQFIVDVHVMQHQEHDGGHLLALDQVVHVRCRVVRAGEASAPLCQFIQLLRKPLFLHVDLVVRQALEVLNLQLVRGGLQLLLRDGLDIEAHSSFCELKGELQLKVVDLVRDAQQNIQRRPERAEHRKETRMFLHCLRLLRHQLIDLVLLLDGHCFTDAVDDKSVDRVRQRAFEASCPGLLVETLNGCKVERASVPRKLDLFCGAEPRRQEIH